jgi:hypothetical protein
VHVARNSKTSEKGMPAAQLKSNGSEKQVSRLDQFPDELSCSVEEDEEEEVEEEVGGVVEEEDSYSEEEFESEGEGDEVSEGGSVSDEFEGFQETQVSGVVPISSRTTEAPEVSVLHGSNGFFFTEDVKTGSEELIDLIPETRYGENGVDESLESSISSSESVDGIVDQGRLVGRVNRDNTDEVSEDSYGDDRFQDSVEGLEVECALHGFEQNERWQGTKEAVGKQKTKVQTSYVPLVIRRHEVAIASTRRREDGQAAGVKSISVDKKWDPGFMTRAEQAAFLRRPGSNSSSSFKHQNSFKAERMVNQEAACSHANAASSSSSMPRHITEQSPVLEESFDEPSLQVTDKTAVANSPSLLLPAKIAVGERKQSMSPIRSPPRSPTKAGLSSVTRSQRRSSQADNDSPTAKASPGLWLEKNNERSKSDVQSSIPMHGDNGDFMEGSHISKSGQRRRRRRAKPHWLMKHSDSSGSSDDSLEQEDGDQEGVVYEEDRNRGFDEFSFLRSLEGLDQFRNTNRSRLGIGNGSAEVDTISTATHGKSERRVQRDRNLVGHRRRQQEASRPQCTSEDGAEGDPNGRAQTIEDSMPSRLRESDLEKRLESLNAGEEEEAVNIGGGDELSRAVVSVLNSDAGGNSSLQSDVGTNINAVRLLHARPDAVKLAAVQAAVITAVKSVRSLTGPVAQRVRIQEERGGGSEGNHDEVVWESDLEPSASEVPEGRNVVAAHAQEVSSKPNSENMWSSAHAGMSVQKVNEFLKEGFDEHSHGGSSSSSSNDGEDLQKSFAWWEQSLDVDDFEASLPHSNTLLSSFYRGNVSPGGNTDSSSIPSRINSTDPTSSLYSSVINSAILPVGRVLRLDIHSTWGDPNYVGLAGIEIFDAAGNVLQPLSISEHPSRDQGNADPR